MHQITHNQKILSAENGFILGNGDLSVSIYQGESTIVWRFGKGDVWDRRQDFSDDPKPAHIDEVRQGILEEGWQVGTNGEDFKALRGFRDEKRSREICQGSPQSYETRPYPCPKPVGELAMHLPPDLLEMEIEQTLSVEEGIVHIICRQQELFQITLRCWVDEKENILLVDWKVDALPTASYGREPLVWFSLYRWADPRVEEFAAKQYADFRVGLLTGANDPSKTTPLDPPYVGRCGDLLCVRQDFFPEKTFPQGFSSLMAPLLGGKTEVPQWTQDNTAALHILPGKMQGLFAVGVATTGDEGDAKQTLLRLRDTACAPEFMKDSLHRLKKAMQQFWSRSALLCSEPLLENLWYETLYAFRCIYRGGTVPPGLMFPSTLRDYAHWHGDYHSNYNFQQPFWGICASNHPEGLDSYFDGMQFFFQIGRKIAQDYYGARGTFVQLSAFPIEAEDDPIGVVPLGRMAYMTGWAATLYWERYLYTLDREWLSQTGYPAIRDCALFYTDFVHKGADGLYHAFPSNQGEDGFSGNAEDFLDREEVADYLCYCLRCAVQAAELLQTDADLTQQWKDILENYAVNKANAFPQGSMQQKLAQENPPEFGHSYLIERSPGLPGKPWPLDTEDVYQWYFGHYPTVQLKRLHTGIYNARLDYPRFLDEIRRWRHPNGLCWALSVRNYGQTGAWTETLGVLALVTDSLLQSWDGCLHFFPGVPAEVDVSFEKLRARGAFLVSACRKNGAVQEIQVYSEKGGRCVFENPWPTAVVCDENGTPQPLNTVRENGFSFDTVPGKTYYIQEK